MWVGEASGIRWLFYISGGAAVFCLIAVVSYVLALQPGSADRAYQPPADSGESKTTTSGSAWLAEYDGDPALNLIYGYSEKKQSITALILEIWNQNDGSLAYLTVPTDTGYTISKELYQRLAAVWPEVPQMMRLSLLYQYFEGEDSFEYGCAVVGELLGAKIQSYTAFSTQELKERFKKNKKGVWKLQKEFQAELTAWEEKPWNEREEFLEEYITNLYKNIKTSRSLQERIAGLSFYKPLSCETVSYYKLPGKAQNAGYQPDQNLIRQELGGILK